MEDACLSSVNFRVALTVPEKNALTPSHPLAHLQKCSGVFTHLPDKPLPLRCTLRAEETGWLGGTPAPGADLRLQP